MNSTNIVRFYSFLALLLLNNVVYAESKNASQIDTEKLAVELYNNKGDVTKKAYFENMLNNIGVEINKYPNDPTLWFVKGRIKRLQLSLRMIEMRKLSMTREERLSDKIRNKLMQESHDDYRKALELDVSPDAPRHLNGEMLITMSTNDVLTPSDIKVSAMRRELSLGIKTTNENFEYDTYGSMVSIYIQEKRYDEAMAVLDEMQEKFPTKRNELENSKQKLEMRKAQNAMSDVKKDDKLKQDTKQSTDLSRQSSQAATPSVDRHIDTSPKKKPDYPLYLVILALLAIGVVVLVYLRRHKK